MTPKAIRVNQIILRTDGDCQKPGWGVNCPRMAASLIFFQGARIARNVGANNPCITTNPMMVKGTTIAWRIKNLKIAECWEKKSVAIVANDMNLATIPVVPMKKCE